MKEKFSKRILMSAVAFFGCIAIAVTAFAVPAIGDSVRTVTVDTDTVISENYHGMGENLWPGAYYYGMNDAYQTVNDQRTNTVKAAYMRMMFLPHWLIDLNLSEEEQQYNWENGIYYWNNEDFKGFVKNCETLRDAGTKIQLNFGGRIPLEIADWYSIENVQLSEGGTRSAPKNIDAFANAVVATIFKLKELGIEVEYLSFHNEVNGGNFEAFSDKRIYWCEVVKKSSIALDKAGLRSIALNKAGTRNGIYINATELSGWADEDQIISFMEFAKEHLIDKGYADGLVTHHYVTNKGYETVVRLSDELRNHFPDEEILINEFNGKNANNGESNEQSFNFKDDSIASIITQANAGFNGGAGWFYYGQYIPYPTNVTQSDIGICLWRSPSQGLNQVSETYGNRGLAMRYIPKMSKVVKTEIDSDDIIASAYVKDDDCTVLLSIDKSDSARKLKVYVGEDYIGRKFGVHVNNSPADSDGDGSQDNRLPKKDSDLLPIRSEELVVDTNGFIIWDIPYGEDIRNMTVVLTTMDEQVQVSLQNAELSVMPGESVDISVKDVFGVECDDFNFEIYDYSNVNDEKEDYQFASANTLASVGTLNQGASGIATFTASANLNIGDTVAVKITPNTAMSDEISGYAIAIINIGQYRLYQTYEFIDPQVANPSVLINIGQEVDIKDIMSAPTRSGYKFEGWYESPDFSGEAITKTDANWNGTTYIYGKWSKVE